MLCCPPYGKTGPEFALPIPTCAQMNAAKGTVLFLMALYIGLISACNPGRPANEWRSRMQQALREQLNPLFRIEEVRLVEQLPRTASNKVMRRQLRAEYERSTSP